jgi:hypothetical protein
MTKSPRDVASEALRLAQESLPACSSKFSRKDFTRHQLFAALALKTFLKTDYRGAVQHLANFAELREELGLSEVPPYSTLCYAAKRLLKRGSSSGSSCAPPRAQEGGLIFPNANDLGFAPASGFRQQDEDTQLFHEQRVRRIVVRARVAQKSVDVDAVRVRCIGPQSSQTIRYRTIGFMAAHSLVSPTVAFATSGPMRAQKSPKLSFGSRSSR